MTDLVRIKIQKLYRSFHAGDVAGFPLAEARALIRSGHGAFDGVAAEAAALPSDTFDGLSRAAMIAYAKDHFGVVEAPPEEASDEDLRAALRELAIEHRAADFQAGANRLDHPAQSAQVDGAVTLRGVGSENAVARKPTSTRLPTPSPAGDQLEAVDRAHLEALAKVKFKLAEIDPEMTDDELRAQIRTLAEAAQE